MKLIDTALVLGVCCGFAISFGHALNESMEQGRRATVAKAAACERQGMEFTRLGRAALCYDPAGDVYHKPSKFAEAGTMDGAPVRAE